MAELITLLEQHTDRQPPTVVIQATIWLETALVYVKLVESGQGVNLTVRVCCIGAYVSSESTSQHTQTHNNVLRLDTHCILAMQF